MKFVICLLAIMAIVGFVDASISSNDLTNLENVISTSNDNKMSTQDLAFFLATHNYDATPNEGYVELRLNGHIYKITSNGCKLKLLDA